MINTPYYIIKTIENVMTEKKFKIKIGVSVTEKKDIKVSFAQDASLAKYCF